MKDERFCLVIVDVQKDFYRPDGALSVKGAETMPSRILNFVQKNKAIIEDVIYTLDWHTSDNESFKVNGGPWPIHCVERTTGAEPSFELCYGMEREKIWPKFYQKGQEIDEYGAFSSFKDGKEFGKDVIYLSGANYPKYDGNFVYTSAKKFIVCGLCGDYCVLETIKNLKKIPGVEVYAALQLIDSIDGGEKLHKYIDEVTNERHFIKCSGDYSLLKL